MKFNNAKFKVAFNKHFGWPPYNKELAAKTGVARPLMYKMHTDGNPSRDVLATLCKKMGVKMESFFTTK